MIIKHRKKILSEINNVSDLEFFLIQNCVYKFFKKIHSEFVDSINTSIINTETLNYKQIKPWLKSILKYPDSVYQRNFLYCMGWDDNEIEDFIIQKQKNNSAILSQKKKINPEKYYNTTPTRIEYWLKKGFDLETSKKKLTERQTTFSLEKCIQKHGKTKGEKIFKERQKKWISTLQSKINYLENQSKKNSYKYEKYSSEKLINRSSFLDSTKKIILDGLKFENIQSFVDFIVKSVDIKRYSDIQPYITSKIIHKHYNVSKKEIRNFFYIKTFYTLAKQTYGVPVYHNKIRFKSIKEYEIALFLEKNEIDYVYENYYPNKKFKFDFFLPRYKIYIEYYGMLDGKNPSNLNQIQTEYFTKMEKKNFYCKQENIELIQDVNFNNLIRKIKQII